VSPEGQNILAHLEAVAAERRTRAADPVLASRVERVKAYQHARFAQTYADLLAHPRYGKAASFFLEDLYGPQDFTARDAQFARIVPGLVRLFPLDIVRTVAALGELHALSERLDGAMGAEVREGPVDAASYEQAWRRVGKPIDRERQIALMLQVGTSLDAFTRKPLLRHSLRFMRGPAAAAGLAALQRFLERGFDTFREMQGGQFFLATVAKRERDLAAELFGSNPSPPRL